MKSLYEDLGVQKTAALDQIKSAHRKGVRKHHPDKKGGCREAFQRVQHAYEVLSDPEKRKRHDETGDDGSTQPAAPSLEALIADAWNQVIEQCDPEQDLIGILRTALRDAANRASVCARAAARKMEKFERMLERLQAGPESVLRGVLEHRCAEQRRACLQNEKAALTLTDAVKLLDEASYRHEPLFRQRPGNQTKSFVDQMMEELRCDASGKDGRDRRGPDRHTSFTGGKW